MSAPGEEGLLAEAKNDKGKLTRASIKQWIVENGKLTAKQFMINSPFSTETDERKLLNAYLAFIEQESAANRQVKDAQKLLDAKVAAQYAKRSIDKIKTLVADDKWLTTLAADVQTELDLVSQALTGRIKQLAERYAEPLPQLANDVAALSACVEAHLKQMGFI